MDFTDALKAGGASATLIAIVGIVGKILHSVCGHRIRSECCGREGTVGVKVENMPSPEKRPSLTVPEKVVVVEEKKLEPPTEPVNRLMTTGADPLRC